MCVLASVWEEQRMRMLVWPLLLANYKVTVNCNFTIPISMSRDYSIMPQKAAINFIDKLSRCTAKCTNWHVRPWNTQISLRNRVVWSVFVVRFLESQWSHVSSGEGGLRCADAQSCLICADPESFVREGPTLTSFCRGVSDDPSKYNYKRAIIGPPAKRH